LFGNAEPHIHTLEGNWGFWKSRIPDDTSLLRRARYNSHNSKLASPQFLRKVVPFALAHLHFGPAFPAPGEENLCTLLQNPKVDFGGHCLACRSSSVTCRAVFPFWEAMDSAPNVSTLNLQWRKDTWDLKLNQCEEVLARRHGHGLRICMCNICLGENRSLRKPEVVLNHLNLYGRASWLRGSTQVRFIFFCSLFP
jgi:hypothetical protein